MDAIDTFVVRCESRRLTSRGILPSLISNLGTRHGWILCKAAIRSKDLTSGVENDADIFYDSDAETLVMGPPNHNDDVDRTGDDNGYSYQCEDKCDTDRGDGPDDDKKGRKVSQAQANCVTIYLDSAALAK